MHLKQINLNPQSYPTRDFYPFNLSIFQNTNSIQLNSSISFFIGENGSGKSTLLRSIANAAKIHIWDSADHYQLELNDYENQLHASIQLEWQKERPYGAFFSSDNFKYFARTLERWAKNDPQMLDYFGGESLLTKSHGQCNMTFFSNRFKLEGLYLLDEPEAALSPKKLLELMDLIRKTSKTNRAQYIVATHSPLLMSIPEAEIFSFDGSCIDRIKYVDTDYFKIYQEFLSRFKS